MEVRFCSSEHFEVKTSSVHYVYKKINHSEWQVSNLKLLRLEKIDEEFYITNKLKDERIIGNEEAIIILEFLKTLNPNENSLMKGDVREF